MKHFLLSGPTLLNVSGGRTSAMMLRRHLDAHDGVLPDDAHAVFANTGRERAAAVARVRAAMEREGAR